MILHEENTVLQSLIHQFPGIDNFGCNYIISNDVYLISYLVGELGPVVTVSLIKMVRVGDDGVVPSNMLSLP